MTEVLESFCPECGYSLRGIASDRCPECGHAIDPLSTPSPIPWLHRRAIGIWRAYWRTVWLVTFNPRLVANDVQRPVNFKEAQKFRRMTTWIAWIPLALVAAAGFCAVTFSQSTSPAAAWYR